MSGLRRDRVRSKIVSLAVCATVLAPTFGLAGCASEKPPSYVQGPPVHIQKVEMEDDGQPVQAPPARRVRAEEDDPSQPWSPNYGGPAKPNAGTLVMPAPLRAPNPYVPAQVDAATVKPVSTGTLTRLSEADAEMVMALAINAHEMRRR